MDRAAAAKIGGMDRQTRLYISGVNESAGIDPAHLVEQFSIRNPNIADLRRLVACCVEWGQHANSSASRFCRLSCQLSAPSSAGMGKPVCLGCWSDMIGVGVT